MATLTVPVLLPSPSEDAENLRKACQGWGTDEKAIISILGHRDATQRKQIRKAYEELYQEDLVERLKSELSGDFEKAVYLWILDPADRDAVLANTALRNAIPDIRVIIEIACVRSPIELLAVKQAYQSRYKRSLEEDVASHTTGDFRKLLVALVSTYRYGGDEINMSLALSEAEILREALQSFGLEEIIRILSTRSKTQVSATLNHYKDKYGTSIKKGFMGGPGNEIAVALRAVVGCISDPHKYFEKVLSKAIKGLGTDEDALTRIIVTCSEKDLKDIMEVYYRRNSITLSHAVADDTSGDYKAFLLTLLGDQDSATRT